MQRPYLSGPMTGVGAHNFPAFFEADTKLRSFGYDPINPAAEKLPRGARWEDWESAYNHAQIVEAPWEEYMRRDLRMVLEADGIILLRGWEKSQGACLELVTAVSVGHHISLYVENHATSCLELYNADRESVYDTALHYLVRCGMKRNRLSA